MILAIEGFESFGSSGTATGISAKYRGTIAESNYTIQAGRVAGQSCRFGTGGTIASIPLVGQPGTVVIGCGLLQDAFTSDQCILNFIDGAATQVQVFLTTAGTLKVYRSTGQANLLGTTSAALTASVWKYVEIKIKFHGSTGTVDVHFDGVSVLSLTGQNTSASGGAQATQFQLRGSLNLNDHTTFDDVFVLDSAGSVNNDFLGDMVVKLSLPVSDASPNQFTPSGAGSHFSKVDETPNDGDTTYLEDATSAHKELFGIGAVSFASIAGCQINTVARVTDATALSIIPTIHSSGTDSDGTTTPLGTDFANVPMIVENDPHTSAPFTAAGFNSLEAGFKIA